MRSPRGQFTTARMLVLTVATLAATCPPAGKAFGQFGDNPVYVDNSPRAWELFRRAADQTPDNPGEAARLYQEVLDEYALKLIPISEAEAAHFASARRRVHDALLHNVDLLERYRHIETPQARRFLESGALERLIETRFLTEPALDATLRLAQADVESARFARAVQRLLEVGRHPDLAGRQAAHRWFLLGLAANHLENTDLRNRAINELASSSDPTSAALHEELMRILRAGPGPQEMRGTSIFDAAPDADVSSIVTTPIWEVPLTETPVNHVFQAGNRPANRINLDAARETGMLLNAAPTLAGRAVIINEGHHVRALDRFSHRQFWETSIGGAMAISPQRRQQIGDLNIVTVAGDYVVTITGHASPQTARQTGVIACLDRRTGDLLWTVHLGKLDGRDDLNGLFPHGAPVVADGTVFVLARRRSGQSLMSGYAVALDLHDNGRVRWIRYLASCGGLQNAITRPFSTITYDNGDLFVASALGAVARLGVTTGEIVWLKRMAVPLRSVTTPPWAIGMPAITPAGVFTVAPNETDIVQFDRETGTEIARYSAREWGSPQYLLTAGEWVFGVGNDVVGVHLTDPVAPAWRLGATVPTLGFDDLRGRVQLAGTTLVVPTSQGILFVDGESGHLLRTIPVDGASNPLVIGAELFVAQTDRLTAFVPLAVAEARLREQIAESPRDPEPALSLLRLATQAPSSQRAVDLALESAEFVTAAIERMKPGHARESTQTQLFELLIAVSAFDADIDYETGSALHGRIGAAAASIEQRIEHLLARGNWLTEQARRRDRAYLAEAIESFQLILSDPMLADADRQREEIIQPAARVAVDRLAALLGEFGVGGYEPLAGTARRRFAEIGEEAPPEALVALAREFPFAAISREAGLAASQKYRRRGEPRRALQILHDLHTSSTGDHERAEIVGRIVQLAVEQRWPHLAAAWLTAARSEHGFASLPDPETGIDRTIDEWFASGAAGPRRARLPKLGPIAADPNEFLPTIEGRLITIRPSVERPPSDFALIQKGAELVRVSSHDLNVDWRAPLPQGSVELLAFEGDRIVLFAPDVGEVLVLDAKSGEPQWRSGNLRDSLIALAKRRSNAPGAGIALPDAGGTRRVGSFEPLPMILGDALIAVGRSGGAFRTQIDHDAGDQVVWQRDHELRAVHFAAIHDLAIVLAGEWRDPTTRRARGKLIMLDPATGSTLGEITPRGGELIKWLIVMPRGIVVFGTDAAIEAIDLVSGQRRWSNVSPEAGWFTRGWRFGEQVLVADATTRLHALDLTTGRLSGAFEPAEDRGGQPSKLEHVQTRGDRALAHYQQRVVWFERDGSVSGQDILPHERKFSHVLLGQNRMAVISHVPNPDPSVRRQRRFVDRIYIFSDSCKLLDEEIIPANRNPAKEAMAIDGWLLLSERVSERVSDRDQTVAVPMR